MAEEDVMKTDKSHNIYSNAEEEDDDDDDNMANELQYDETESVASDEPFTVENIDESDNLFDIDDEQARLL